jgi:GYF domain 2
MSEELVSTGIVGNANSIAQEYYVLNAATRQTYGPLAEETLKEWILQKRITLQDLVNKQGEQNWTPILQSSFGKPLIDQANLDRLASTTCPRCGSAMIARVKQSATGLALILVGLFLTPILIGLPIFIVGMVMRHGGKGGQAYFACPTCTYSSL